VCSTLQDLAAYMERPTIDDISVKCGARAILNVTDGIVCFMENVGFTEPCAAIWTYNALNTLAECGDLCRIHSLSGLPNNEDPPECDLVPCIQCDEDKSGFYFKLFGGRTRRRSGLLSAIVRNCTEVPRLIHRDPCDDSPATPVPTNAPAESPTAEPISSGVRSRSIPWMFFSVIVSVFVIQ
jgi:hypothetical protein